MTLFAATDTISLASPADVERYGAYVVDRDPTDPRPRYRFDGRITADGSSGFPAEPHRYHLYAGWACPWAQRTTIVRALVGLEDVISLSYVDDRRDARGWAFRERNGPDPVNGFAFLRDAYEATEPGFDGHVSVPTLWDRKTGKVVSNTYEHIEIDLATQFGTWSTTDHHPYPRHLRAAIEDLDRWIGPSVNHGVHLAATRGLAAVTARDALTAALAHLDERLSETRYLLGDEITEADVRLWVTLARWDGDLHRYRHVWAYARDLYRHPAFATTTDFARFPSPIPRRRFWTALVPSERLGTSAR